MGSCPELTKLSLEYDRLLAEYRSLSERFSVSITTRPEKVVGEHYFNYQFQVSLLIDPLTNLKRRVGMMPDSSGKFLLLDKVNSLISDANIIAMNL